MNIITLDFETYFDDDYTLKKMTTEAYIRDPRFEVHGCAVKWSPNAKTVWVPGDELGDSGFKIALEDSVVLCHHAHFDGLILSHHYGVKPHAWLDTLSMARLVLGNHVRVGLDALAAHYGLSAKSVPYNLFKGRRWSELDVDVRFLLARGACHDVELTWQIFNLLAKGFPAEEYRAIDTTVRMFTEPVLEGDLELLGKVWRDERARKRDLMADLGVSVADLQSADLFQRLLEAEGVEVPTKEGKAGPIPCFAKTDQFMKDALDDDNPRVAALVAARLGVRSTINETRAERLGYMASRGRMPAYLNYCGAHTTRWSGGDKVNWQNFKRGGEIRQAIRAPAGYKLAIVDLSQIECRILNYLAGQWDVIEKFKNNEDPYIGIASEAYGFAVSKSDAKERGTGKQLELSCGFGAGAETIQNTARLGTYGPPVIINVATATRWRDIYRSTHPFVVAYWRQAEDVIRHLAGGTSMDWGPMKVRDGKIILPNGAALNYTTLRWDDQERAWKLRTRNGWVKLYGGKLVENVVQALARVVMSQAMNRITAAGNKIALCAHDEVVCCLPDDDAIYDRFEAIKTEMVREPAWLPGIPLACEGAISERYEK